MQLEIENELLKDQDDDPTLLESSEARKKAVRVLNAEEQLAEEQRLLDEEDKAEHDAQMAEMEKCALQYWYIVVALEVIDTIKLIRSADNRLPVEHIFTIG